MIPSTDSELNQLLGNFLYRLRAGERGFQLPDRTREAVAMRLRVLDTLLLPTFKTGEKGRVRAAIGLTLSGWINAKTDDPGKTLDLLTEALCDLPLWAVEAALRDLFQGKVFGCNVDFAPSAARMHSHAEFLMRDILAEQAQLKALLVAASQKALPALPPMSKAVHEGLLELSRKLKDSDALPGVTLAEQKRRERQADMERENILAAYRVNKMDPVMIDGMPVSLSLLARLGAVPRNAKKKAVP